MRTWFDRCQAGCVGVEGCAGYGPLLTWRAQLGFIAETCDRCPTRTASCSTPSSPGSDRQHDEGAICGATASAGSPGSFGASGAARTSSPARRVASAGYRIHAQAARGTRQTCSDTWRFKNAETSSNTIAATAASSGRAAEGLGYIAPWARLLAAVML